MELIPFLPQKVKALNLIATAIPHVVSFRAKSWHRIFCETKIIWKSNSKRLRFESAAPH